MWVHINSCLRLCFAIMHDLSIKVRVVAGRPKQTTLSHSIELLPGSQPKTIGNHTETTKPHYFFSNEWLKKFLSEQLWCLELKIDMLFHPVALLYHLCKKKVDLHCCFLLKLIFGHIFIEL